MISAPFDIDFVYVILIFFLYLLSHFRYQVGNRKSVVLLKLDYRPNRNLSLEVSGIHRDSVTLVGHEL